LPNRLLHAILVGIAALALLVPTLAVRYGPRVVPRRDGRAALPARRVVPPAELPAVEPVAIADLSPEEAQAYNAGVAFSDAPNPAARPFHIGEDASDTARARDCLAAAVYYEAGDDPPGERAVAQVVLNRVRHPAFPKTVCGVVFQGSERRTGCQFTFTCDGSIARRKPTDALWRAARDLATEALAGAVYRPVGYATHYHTDYVVPYWQASLDKIVAVHTQLFYRWSGWWGTRPAFDRHAQPGEPVVEALASLSDAHRPALALEWSDPLVDPTADGGVTADLAAAAPRTFDPRPVASDANSFLIAIPRGTDPALYPALAAKACGERATCKFDGWTDAKRTPARLPLQAGDLAAMTFGYLRDRAAGIERTLWNCQQVKRADPRRCLKVQVYQPATADAQVVVTPVPSSTPTPTGVAKPTAELNGVRRKTETKPAAVSTPKPSAKTE